MSRRKLIWHIGLSDAPRAVVPANLETHRGALEAAGVHVAASSEEVRLATHELLHTHRQAALARSEVEGRWARICDQVWQHKGVSVLSTPDLCAADKDQIRMALDPLIGVEVHLVVTLDSFSQQAYGGWLAELRSGRTTGWEKYVARVLSPAPEHRQADQFWAGHDLTAVLSRWGWTFRADRLHVVADRDVGQHWLQLLDFAGVPAEGLAAVVPSYADPAGVAVLRKVNRQLDEPLGASTVELLTGVDHEISAMPVAPTAALAPLVARWACDLTSAGHDVRGDLAMLVDEGETTLPGPHDQLGVAVDALAEALAENSRLRRVVVDLESERDRLDRKRRKHKRRLKRALAGSEPDSP
jgi:hypothetical protein